MVDADRVAPERFGKGSDNRGLESDARTSKPMNQCPPFSEIFVTTHFLVPNPVWIYYLFNIITFSKAGARKRPDRKIDRLKEPIPGGENFWNFVRGKESLLRVLYPSFQRLKLRHFLLFQDSGCGKPHRRLNLLWSHVSPITAVKPVNFF